MAPPDADGQRDEVVAFAYEALSLEDAGEMRRAALRHIVSAVGADAAELMVAGRDGAELQTTAAFGLPERILPRDSGAIVAVAVAQERAIVRELDEADYRAMPQLAKDGMRYGIAVPMVSGDVVRVGAAYAREHPFTEDDAAPIFGCGSLLAAAIARIGAEQQLAEREAIMQMILDQLPAVVWTVDLRLTINMVRGSGLPNVVDSVQRLVGKSLPDTLTGSDADRDFALAAHRQALRGEAAEYSYAYHGRMWDVSVRPLRSGDGSIRGCVGLAFDVTDRARVQNELRYFAARLSNAQEAERRRIARELHDDMGQRLTALNFELDLLRREAPQAAARVEQMLVLLRGASEAVRRIATDLRPSALDRLGLGAAIENELAAFERRTGIAYELILPSDEPSLDGDQTIAVYRIVQEALTNVARHSGASHVRVEATLAEQELIVEVADDGRGITAEESARHDGLGLLGARERAYALGGSVHVTAPPGGGTTLRLTVPLAGKRPTL